MAGPRDSYDASEEVDVMAGDDDDFTPDIDGPEDDEEFETDEDELEADEEGDEEELDASEEDEGEEGDDEDVEQEDEGEDELGPIDPPANWPQQEQQFFKELPRPSSTPISTAPAT